MVSSPSSITAWATCTPVASALAHAVRRRWCYPRCRPARAADRVVFPGVGAIRDCMAEIRRLECDQLLADALVTQHKPVLASAWACRR